MIAEFVSLFQNEIYGQVLHLAKVWAPVWLPLLFLFIWTDLWLKYKRREWIHKQGSVLLELRFPKEVPRSPAAMELVLYGLWEDVFGTFFDTWIDGKLRDWFSLEIVSIGGQVKFYIWCLPRWKTLVATRIYAQYPGVEVHEVSDYALGAHWDPDTMRMSAFQSALVKADVYPIKTYIDWGLDKLGNEDEEKVDPLTPVIEYLGSLKPGEQAWIQILIQAHRKEKPLLDAVFFPKKHWQTTVQKEVEKIVKEAIFKPEPGSTRKPSSLDLSKVQQEAIEAIQRSQSKLAFDVMMRNIYFAKKEDYNKLATISFVGSMRQFSSRNLNGIKPIFHGINYPWQDFHEIRKREYWYKIFDAYKRRSAFNGLYKNWNAKSFVLNTEELATLFHPPSQLVAATPTLSRIPSKKAEAPANLPV